MFQLFRYFLVADIFLILFIGMLTILLILSDNFNWTLDLFTVLIILLNFAATALVAFYENCPLPLHQFYLVALNGIMVSHIF